MKTVILTPQIPEAIANGGIGTFVTHFANLLVRSGHSDITVIYTNAYDRPANELKALYKARGIQLELIYDGNKPLEMWPGYLHIVRESELSDQIIPEDTDILYLADYHANGWITARKRRYKDKKLPAIVSVLHGPSEWHRQGQQEWPHHYTQLVDDFAERYTAQYSDFVVAPSQYMLDWARKNSWKLPPQDRLSVLGYPWTPSSIPESASEHPERFKRIAFFGRVETRKGFDLFVHALLKLKAESRLDGIEEIVIVGNNGVHQFGTIDVAADLLRKELGIIVTPCTGLNTFEAQDYLRQHAANTLVIMPSRVDNMPFAIIETSLIPNLNFICSNAGGIPEIFVDSGKHQLFEPEFRAVAQAVGKWLEDGPQPSAKLGHYDWVSANERWLKFHERVRNYTAQLKHVHTATPVPHTRESKSVDVCLSYYNLGKYLPYALESLDQQTTDDFNVYVVNDGSTEEESIEAFESMKRQYGQNGWQFVSQTNQGVCAARNLAALLGSAEYILFMDPDNIAAPNMVERFRDCIATSGDDCLTSWMYMFSGEGWPYLGGLQSKILPPPAMLYHPVGNYPPLGLMINPYGDLNCIMRRSAFEAVGGFTMDQPKYVNKEDQELLTILSLEGYKLDVIPEYLFFYRHRTDSRLRTTEEFQNDARVLRVYEEKLRSLGLEDIAPMILTLHYIVRDNWLQGGPNQRAIFRNKQGSAFATQEDYLVNGVPWKDLLNAMKNKVMKNLRRGPIS